MELFNKKPESGEALFRLCVDFGYDESSPIPKNKPKHKNFSAVVLAIPGTHGYLFPDERPETIEFLSYIEDEKGRPCGIRCKVRDYSEAIAKALDKLGISQQMGIEKHPETELELYPDQPKFQENSSFENGVTTRIYRHYRLERI
ncbi:MAG: hypothetical protein IJ072_05025 [Oscillospiraceae bacterium]|nr:hypothetical protein [Oscillospiraceae bacterium]